MTDAREAQEQAVPLAADRGRTGLALVGGRVSWWPAAAVAVVIAAALVVGAIRTDQAHSRAASDQHMAQMASLASAISALAAGMEDEQNLAAVYIAQGRPVTADALVTFQGQEAVTNRQADQVSSLARQAGSGLAPSARAALDVVLSDLRDLLAIREDAVSTRMPVLDVIDQYSRAVSGLLAFDSQIAPETTDAALARDARALSALEQAENAAAQERSILGAALMTRHFQAGEAQALSAAQSQEEAALTEFRGQATAGQQQQYTKAMAGAQVRAATFMLSQALASNLTVAGRPGSRLPGGELTWTDDMTFTVDQMRVVAQDLLSSIAAQSKALQAQAGGTVTDTWIEVAVVVAVVLAAAIVISRRRTRRR
jgi:Nitrate and nitrite sensing